MQSWGKHGFESTRISESFPGRSALLGLLGACLGIDRQDKERQRQLAESVAFAVRIDKTEYVPQKMTDYHTVKDARVDYHSLKSHETIETWREYWQDVKYTVAVWSLPNAEISLEQLREAICKPVYTPFLGRKSCPMTRPLFEAMVNADDAKTALGQIEPVAGMVYSEERDDKQRQIRLRDVPIIDQPRQFDTRTVYVYSLSSGGQS